MNVSVYKNNLPTLNLFLTCRNLFQLLNTKEDILKNVGNQTISNKQTAIDFNSIE